MNQLGISKPVYYCDSIYKIQKNRLKVRKRAKIRNRYNEANDTTPDPGYQWRK